MTLIDALTAKRHDDGKVADWAANINNKYKFDEYGILTEKRGPFTPWTPCSINRDMLTRTDFIPMWETPALMVPELGEVWGYTAVSSAKEIMAWAHYYPDYDCVGLTWAIDGVVWIVTKDIIHDQNGWRLVYSPDPERMRRAQNG